MRPRPLYVFFLLIAVLFAVVDYNAERGMYGPPPPAPATHRASGTDLSFTGATWLGVDDGTMESRQSKEVLQGLMTHFVLAIACVFVVCIAVGVVVEIFFPPKSRSLPPHI